LIQRALILLVFLMSACQTPTEVIELDSRIEDRAFAKIEYGKDVELKRAVIIDVRSRFDFEMSRVPRSFFAYWKDWDLSGYTGPRLQKKAQDLQRLLSLKGIDPLVQVVILGKGLSGQGEEFLLASTLRTLGIERIAFMSQQQARRAMLAKNIPEIENLPYWTRQVYGSYDCNLGIGLTDVEKRQQADIVIGSLKPGDIPPEKIFSQQLKLIQTKWPKAMRLRLYSPNNLWAYGLAMYFKDQGRKPCIL
jgi:hypothetical protein